MKRGVCVRQHDVTDCAAACLASVTVYYEFRISVARIRQIAHTDRYDTNLCFFLRCYFGQVLLLSLMGLLRRGN